MDKNGDVDHEYQGRAWKVRGALVALRAELAHADAVNGAAVAIHVETLVSAPSAALSAPLAFERRRIVELCEYPHSVAELSALLRTPLG